MKNLRLKYTLLITFFIAVGILRSNAQLINTIAGTGVAGYTGDGFPAVSAKVSGPEGVVVDGSGTIYFSDAGNHVIRKISPSGIISTFAGNGTAGYTGDGFAATAAELNHPIGLALDRSGNVYVADYASSCVRKISAAGIISTVAGTGVYGLSVDGIPAIAAELREPWGVTVDTANNIYITDQDDSRVRKINAAGIISTIAGGGVYGYVGDGGPATAAYLFAPEGIAVDDTGNIFFVDDVDQRIRKIDLAGNIWTIAGNGTAGFSGDGMPATTAEMSYPDGVATDHHGNLYITDFGNSRIRLINPAGIINTIAGCGVPGYGGDGMPALSAKFSQAANAAPDAFGNLYIPDILNNRLRMVACITGPSVPAITGSTTACMGADMPLSNGTAGGAWSSSNTAVAVIGSTGIVTGVSLGTVTITYNFINACGSAMTTQTLIVGSMPTDAGVITGTDSVCPGHTVVLSDDLTGGAWVSKQTSIASITSGGVAKGISDGADTILYIVSNTCGADTALIHLKVVAVCPDDVRNTIAPAASLSVYPDPNNGTFVLNVPSATTQDMSVIVTNVLDRKIKEIITSTNHETEIQLDAPPGIYFLTAITAEGKQNAKIIVQ